MTSQDPLANLTQLLRGSIANEGDVEAMPEHRDEAIARIAEALRARKTAVRRRRFIGGLAVAASVGILVGAGFALHRQSASGNETVSQLGRLVDPAGAATALRDGHTEHVSGGDRLAEGTELRTTTAEASLDFESGTHVTLGRTSLVRLVEQSSHKRFALSSGELTARVAKLKAGEQFIVATADAEIEVRGTAFRVSIVKGDQACESGTPTRLDVSEGVVVVRHAGSEVRVPAGAHWPTCQSQVPEATAFTPAPTPMPIPKASTASATTSHAASPAPSSRLSEQNDLFDEGMRLKRAGNLSGALTRFEKLTSEYPGGPLTESATVERMRVLNGLDKSRGASAAHDYLKRFPHGFARQEAESLVP